MRGREFHFLVFCISVLFFTAACGDKKAKAEAPVAESQEMMASPAEPPKEMPEQDPYADKREADVVESDMMKNNQRKVWDKSRKHWRKMNKCN